MLCVFHFEYKRKNYVIGIDEKYCKPYYGAINWDMIHHIIEETFSYIWGYGIKANIQVSALNMIDDSIKDRLTYGNIVSVDNSNNLACSIDKYKVDSL